MICEKCSGAMVQDKAYNFSSGAVSRIWRCPAAACRHVAEKVPAPQAPVPAPAPTSVPISPISPARPRVLASLPSTVPVFRNHDYSLGSTHQPDGCCEARVYSGRSRCRTKALYGERLCRYHKSKFEQSQVEARA